jgi:uncharacterized membrane protein
MPLVRPIYKTFTHFFYPVFSMGGSCFRTGAGAVFPPGLWSVVFLASPPSGDVADRLPGDDFVSCFLPCTPNPTTGFFFYAPRSKVIELEISVEQAMALIMSAGMAQPSPDVQKKLAALAENSRAARPSTPALPSTAPAK